MGQAAAFSFYPGKNLGACGEGGAVTTNDEAHRAQDAMLRDHGQAKKYYHDVEGYNGRLDAIQAGILRVKLRTLADWNDKRRAAAVQLIRTAGGRDRCLNHSHQPSWTKSIYHLYAIVTRNAKK